MGTPQERTLSIKDFKGVSRYLSSPNQRPNKFKTIQNMYAVNKGELGLVPGISEIVASAAIPGLTAVKDIASLKQTWGTEGWVIHYTASGSMPVPSGHGYSTLGAATNTRRVAIYFVGPGGNTSFVRDAAQQFGASGLSVQLPTNIPSYVHCVHFYVEVIAGGTTGHFLWAGSATRKAGSFASTITLFEPPSSGVIANAITEDEPTSVSFTFGTDGNLEPGRTYYFGVTPWIDAGAEHVISNGSNSGANKFAVALPSGKSSISVVFNGMASTAGDNTPIAYTRSILFMGTTPEDLLPCYTSTDGTVAPVASLSLGSAITVKDLPYNNSFTADASDGGTRGQAPASRAFLTTRDTDFARAIPTASSSQTLTNVAAACFIQLPYSTSTHIELYPKMGYGLGAANQGEVWGDTSLSVDFPFSSSPLGNRLYFANGYNTPYYTNGIVMHAIIRDYQTAKIPITELIMAFQDSLIFAGGRANFSNTDGTAVYSETGNPWSVTATPSATPAYNFILANQGDNSKIVGLGVYSKDLSDVGSATFLLIGKEEATISWNGGRSASNSVVSQVGKAVGWPSAKAFVLTPWGPFLFGRDNIYFCNGTDMKQAGNDVAEFIQDIDADNYQYCQASYIKNRAIFSYRDTQNIDRELWADFRQDDEDGLEMVFSGPHQLQEFTGQAVAQTYNGEKFYRACFLNDVIYRRDVEGTFTNVGSNIPVVIQTHDMSFGNDEFKKLLRAFYLRAKILKAETLTLSLTIYDNEGVGDGLDVTTDSETTITETFTLPFTGSSQIYRLFQKQFANRYAGTLFNATLSFSTNVDFRIVSMAWLFKIQGRRLL